MRRHRYATDGTKPAVRQPSGLALVDAERDGSLKL
jgi:hypothetical protein